MKAISNENKINLVGLSDDKLIYIYMDKNDYSKHQHFLIWSKWREPEYTETHVILYNQKPNGKKRL